ncbi:MAG: phosphoglucosamine mutase [Verrucomicrobia bacterium]|nr:phosphoglucosamine mutase [Kiritimatiellia bacterium]MCO6400989.1 phosphoglucosamine mutase [Verrucomicrobiota bacterium]
MKESLKVGVSGVRGVVGASFTPQLALGFAQAFGTFVGRGPVLVGRDTRPSGLMFEYAVVAGLQSVGCKPILLGVVPTPTVLLMTKELGARGGIAITASHNAAEWNALKFVDRRGLFLEENRAQELFDVYHQQDFPLVAEADLPATAALPNPVETHFKRIVDYVDANAIRRRQFRVAVDVVNGVGALYSVPFLQSLLGCEVVPIHVAPTGRFERDPEPLPEHLGALSRAVVEHRCDIGFAQDPDGDRLAIVDEQGRPIGEDLTLAFSARQVLEVHGKGPVAISLSCSRAVEDVVRALWCEVTRTRIGETNVARVMQEQGAVVGGEHNGGVIIPAIHTCRDSFAAMAVILELLARTGMRVSDVRAEIPRYVMVRRKLPARAERAPEALRELRRHYAERKMNFLDGLFIEFEQAWAHVRRSNTEPVIRLAVEAPDREQANARADEIEALLAPLLD